MAAIISSQLLLYLGFPLILQLTSMQRYHLCRRGHNGIPDAGTILLLGHNIDTDIDMDTTFPSIDLLWILAELNLFRMYLNLPLNLYHPVV